MAKFTFEVHSLVSNAQGNSISNWGKKYLSYKQLYDLFAFEETIDTLMSGSSIRTYNSDGTSTLWIIASAHNNNSMLIDWSK